MQVNANTKGLGMQENAVTAQSERKKGKQKKGNTVIVGNLQAQKTGSEQRADKLLRAKREALKLKLDVLKKDSDMDDTVKEADEQVKKLREDAALASEVLKGFPIMEENLEQEKENMTDKEYAERAKELRGAKREWTSRQNSASDSIKQIHQSMEAFAVERLKKHDMVDAGEAAEDIEASAVQESVRDVLSEGMDRVEEKQQEQKEQAEAVQKSQPEKKKDTSENTEQLQDVSNMIVESDIVLERETAKITSQINIPEEDLKGLFVDEES